MPARLPAVVVTLEATQHFLPELNGSTIYHQPPSPDFPAIWELVPTLNPLRTTQPTPGPRRQFTATSFGSATGTVEVEVEVGGGVLAGNSVWVGISVEAGCVIDGVKIDNVGVWVAALAGRLHASIAKTRANTNKKLRDFIAVLLYFCSILPNEPANDNRPFGVLLIFSFARSF